MKLFRLRFVLLGLLLCVCHVWSLSCRTEFDDPASKAYQSEIVLIGTVSQILPPVDNIYNITVKIGSKRDIFKGEQLLKRGRRSRVGLITVGQFGAEDLDRCVASVTQDSQYMFFLNSTSDSKFLTNSRMPVSSDNKKDFKKAKKYVKKILKCRGKCVKLPVVDSRRALKDKRVGFGKNIELNCRIKRSTFPLPLFQWYKDGLKIRSFRGLSIRTGKKGSRLKKSKANLADAGTYECIIKNVYGEIKQASVISITGVQRPEASRTMKNKKQKFNGTLKLTCRVKGDTVPKPKFRWFKDGREIKNGDRPGLSIKTRGSESRLRKDRAVLSDGGTYLCLAENIGGNKTQRSVVTITDAPYTNSSTTAPQKTRPCDEKDKHYCLNNGTCNIMVELNEKFCTCRPGYKGDRCVELDLRYDKAREKKLAQDRTIVIVGIISGILLFIGICVASYFLAKRRRDQFNRRRRDNARHNIEDIPQVYRPLPACDDVDGTRKHNKKGVIINKETQTIETCFLTGTQEDPKLNLYINPLEGYIRPNREDRNSRSRLTAVSLEGAPRSSAPNSLERKKSSSHENNPDHHNNSPNRPDGPNSKRVPSERENSQPNGARVTPNVGSVNPPAFNLETDSEDEILSEETPLTPLHISEDDDTLRRRRERQQQNEPDRNVSKFPYPRDSSNDSNYSNPPSYTTALEGDKSDKNDKLDRSNSDDRIYASTSPSSSESSSTTEGCDSPNTMYPYEFSLSDPAMNSPAWNERGSPELKKDSPPPYKPVPKYDYTPLYANNDKRAPTKNDKVGNFNRGDISFKHIPFFK